jgi:hypothetical protein
MRRLIPFLGLLTLSGPVASAPGPKGKPVPLYFGTRVGDTWVYEIRTPAAKVDMIEAVSAADEKDGVVVVAVTRTYQGETAVSQQLAVSEQGLQLLAVGGSNLSHAQWVVKVPVKAGDTWTVDLDAPPGRQPLKLTYTVRGEEEVEVPAGKFKAVRVDTTLNDPVVPMPISRWYAPGIGLVKSVSKIGKDDRVQILKSFTTGKK